MKKFTLVFPLALLMFFSGFSQKLDKMNPDVLVLKETSFHFGKIAQGRPVTHDFVVTNRGKTALLIENVEATCGCTTPEWSQEPVLPGAQTVIKVGFNASSEGPFKKEITIIYNDGKSKKLQISGEVYPSPTTSAPVNPSLSLLKQP